MISRMQEFDPKTHPFRAGKIRELGFSWEEVENVVRSYCQEHNISDDDCKKLISARNPDPAKSFERVYDDSTEPLKFTSKDGVPINIYQLMQEYEYDEEESKIILDQYCAHMKYDDRKKEKVFFEWKCWKITPEEVMEEFFKATSHK